MEKFNPRLGRRLAADERMKNLKQLWFNNYTTKKLIRRGERQKQRINEYLLM